MNERIFRLSEIEGDRSFEVLGEILESLDGITHNPKVREMEEKKSSILLFASAVMKNCPGELHRIFDILSKSADGYQHNTAELLQDTVYLFSDPNIQVLFGLRAQKGDANSSTPVLANTAE